MTAATKDLNGVEEKKGSEEILKSTEVKEEETGAAYQKLDEEGREGTIEGIKKRGNQLTNFLRNLVLAIRFQYVVLGLCGFMTLCYSAGAVTGGFLNNWEFRRMYSVGLVYMLFIAGLMWLNFGAKWLLLVFHVGRPRSEKRFPILCNLLALFYFVVTGVLVVAFCTAILLPLVHPEKQIYELFNVPINFVLPFCLQWIMELLFVYYWISKRLSRASMKLMRNPYF